jgi:ATP citrate (pro-S)-lyase
MLATSASANSLMDMNPPTSAEIMMSEPPASSPSVSFENNPVKKVKGDGGQVPFDRETRSFIYGMQPRAVQGMLDFDHMCKRSRPSVAAMIYPFGGHHVQKFYWGTSETLLPVYPSVEEALKKFPEVNVVVNFASFRSVYESTCEIMTYPAIKTIAIIAEGVPEKRARQLLWEAKRRGVLIIGPATVGLLLF